MKLHTLFTGLALTTASMLSNGQQLEISVTNLTQGIHFTPILIGAHNDATHLYAVGEQASGALQAMAEGGDISGLSAMLATANADVVENPAAGLLAPTMTTTTMLDTGDGNRYLSLVAMMLPTNDGFIGVDSWMIPSEAGSYSFTINAYDAGTEANDELAGSMPNPPFITFGAGGTGVETAVSNAKVHIHPGNIGDSDAAGGISDLDSSSHRWLNPVATITIVVK